MLNSEFSTAKNCKKHGELLSWGITNPPEIGVRFHVTDPIKTVTKTRGLSCHLQAKYWIAGHLHSENLGSSGNAGPSIIRFIIIK